MTASRLHARSSGKVPDMWGKWRAIDKAADRIGYWPQALQIVGALVITAWSGLMAWLSSFRDIVSQYGAFGYATVFVVTFLVLSLAFAAMGFGANQFARRRPAQSAAAESAPGGRRPAPSEREEQALDKLTDFVNRHLLDTVSALECFHVRLIEDACQDPSLVRFARNGIFYGDDRARNMYESYSTLGELAHSPARVFSLDEMIKHVATVERHYAAFVAQAAELAKRDVGRRKNPGTLEAWDEWRMRHNAMISVFDENIKTDRRLGELYRPRRASRFGPHIVGSESLFSETP